MKFKIFNSKRNFQNSKDSPEDPKDVREQREQEQNFEHPIDNATDVKILNHTGTQSGRPKTDKESVDDYSLVRSELNLEQNAIFTVTTCKKRSREITISRTLPNGEVSKCKATVGITADGYETGVLTTKHFKIYLALTKFWEEDGKPITGHIHFNTLRVLKEIGLSNTGPNYKTVKRILRNLAQIPISFEKSFFIIEPDNKGGYKTIEDFHIINDLFIYEPRKKTEQKEEARGYCEFQFSTPILKSLINNYTHPLRLDIIRTFEKHKDIAILLYIYIDRNLAFKNKFEIGLEKLFERLDLSQRHVKYLSDRKRVIEPVLDQIRTKELSTGILSYAEILKTASGKDYKLVCHKKPFTKRFKEQKILPEFQPLPTTKTEPEPKPTELKPELLSRLIQYSLTEKQAAKLISEKEPEVIKAQLEYFPFRLKDYKAQGREINEPAILYDSIKENWKAPKGHLNAEKEKEREARRLEEERIALEKRAEEERQEREWAVMEAYKKSLSTDKREELREQALEEIRKIEGVKEEFIGNILIEAKENEILRSGMPDIGK